jgi:hypothetical protein
VTKRGEPVIKKSELVSDIAVLLNADIQNIATLEKATKVDLQNLIDLLAERQ